MNDDRNLTPVQSASDAAPSPGQVARDLRQRAGLSLKQVAEKVGPKTHFTTIAKLENGKMAFTFEWARRLANVYGVTTVTFLGLGEHGHMAKLIPVFWSTRELLLSEEKRTPDAYTAYYTSKAHLFGLTFSGPADLAGDKAIYTAIVDPNVKKLMDSYTYAIVDPESPLTFCVGVYRKEESPRILPWPAPGRSPIYLSSEGPLVLGLVLELQRMMFSRNS